MILESLNTQNPKWLLSNTILGSYAHIIATVGYSCIIMNSSSFGIIFDLVCLVLEGTKERTSLVPSFNMKKYKVKCERTNVLGLDSTSQYIIQFNISN